MTQLSLPMLTYYAGPHLVDAQTVAITQTYRDAVQLCWLKRTRKSMTKRQLAEEAGVYASHLTDYISADDSKRELPAKHIAQFEIACGNRAITQWLAKQANLTILESFIQAKAA